MRLSALARDMLAKALRRSNIFDVIELLPQVTKNF